MNYRLQLVVGDGALFFLEDWKAGGVEITPDVVGLFDVPVQGMRREQFKALLDDYGVVLGTLSFMDMMRLGFSNSWHWRGVRWIDSSEPRLAENASNRVGQLLADNFKQDRKVQTSLLQYMQAAVRKLGPPTLLDGELTRVSGQRERLLVYQIGVIAYDRTPHPLDFLRQVANLSTAAS